MAVLICLMDSSDKQQPFGRNVLIEYAQITAIIDLHIANHLVMMKRENNF